MPLLVYAAMNWYNSEVNQLPVIGPPRGNGKALKDHVISDFRLINEDGQLTTINDWKDKIVIVDFFFFPLSLNLSGHDKKLKGCSDCF